ncbi:GumC family protein [Loktanella salsilacus]|uniref:GumC family protein n=1 Tax=Loktanella salsilacus TaxID=195913 RepID=UPI0020B672C0|nr:polysaccharide biosynthesis tyrosine autokinase [Loktanella salsilacus]UTH46212.1 polysaccharide biosynthesis tyrosine autokinase [Loktanella salsilacus]
MSQMTANSDASRFNAPTEDEDTIDLMALLGTLWRGKWIIVALSLLGAIVAGYYAFRLAVPSYRATTQMALVLDQSPIIDIESVMTGVSSDTSSLNTEMEIIRSRELVSRLVDELDLTQDPEFNPALRPDAGFALSDVVAGIINLIAAPEAEETSSQAEIRNGVIDRVRQVISTSIERQSYIFSISAITGSPGKSALMTNTLAQIYQDDQIAIKVDGTQTAAVWLSARVSELRTELEQGQNEINDLRSRNAMVSPEAMIALNTQSVELASQQQAAQLELERAEEALAEIEAVVTEDVAAKALAVNDAQLRSIAATAAAGGAAAIARFDRRFQQLRQQAAGTRDQLTLRVSDLQAQTDRLSAQFDLQGADLIMIQQLERETEATRVLYETFLNRLRETSVQIGIQQADSRVLSEAIKGIYVAPRKGVILAMGFMLGAMLAAAIVLGREMLQNTFRTAEDLEGATRVSVIGQIPKIPTKGRIPTITYLAEKPTSAAAEAVRNLRTSVLMSNVDNPPQVIMMTSSLPAEGKTTTAIALSQNLAGLGKRVLLIEGDIRRRTFSAYFPDATKRPGILSVIAQFGKEDDRAKAATLDQAVFTPEILGIDVLMGEKSSINAADVFASGAFGDFMKAVRAEYDYIIIDTPPVLVVSDARVIGPYADAIIYVVNWDKTTKVQVNEGLRQLNSVNLKVTGLALTQIDPKGMKRYGYGKGYGYGAYGGGAAGYYDN